MGNLFRAFSANGDEEENINDINNDNNTNAADVSVVNTPSYASEELQKEVSVVHLERLKNFAKENSPVMLETLDAAWSKYGEKPDKIWGTIDKRFPGSFNKYASGVEEEAKKRLEGIIAGREARRASIADREKMRIYRNREALDIARPVLSAVLAADKRPDRISLGLPIEAFIKSSGVFVPNHTDKDTNLPLPEAIVPKLSVADVPPVNEAVVEAVSTYIAPPALTISRNGSINPANDESDKSAVRLTANMVHLPSLSQAVASLKLLTEADLHLFKYICKLQPPPSCIVVALGVLCVLLGTNVHWEDALQLVTDPNLVAKLVELSSKLPELSESRPNTANNTRPVTSGNTLASVNDGSLSQAVELPSDIDVVPVPLPTDWSFSSSPLARPLTNKDITLARRLLNRHPDIRAETRCLGLKISSVDFNELDQVTGPFIALAVLVEWQITFVHEFSRILKEKKAAVAASSQASGDSTSDHSSGNSQTEETDAERHRRASEIYGGFVKSMHK